MRNSCNFWSVRKLIFKNTGKIENRICLAVLDPINLGATAGKPSVSKNTQPIPNLKSNAHQTR